MNERFKTLWFEAAESKNGNSWEEQTEFMKKFAELIVKECINCCDDIDAIQKHYLKYGINQELGASQCIEVIKKHFGVE